MLSKCALFDFGCGVGVAADMRICMKRRRMFSTYWQQ